MQHYLKRTISNILITFSAVLLPNIQSVAQCENYTLSDALSTPKYETRAVWITTLSGLDWPRNKAQSKDGIRKQQEELCQQLDAFKAANFNTILLQVRLRDDVIYPSKKEIFAESLTGTLGKDPGYDPLAFAIEECHHRGMELHAWIVAIPLGSDKQVKQMGKNSMVKKRPDMCIHHNRHWYLDPGHPETKKYLANIVKEVVSQYDVDGINLDYIRYPDRPKSFPDQRTFRKYGNGKTLSQWRRDNITSIVRQIYTTVKALKPWVKVGSSPIGKYEDVARYPSRGWNARSVVFQDAQLWMKEGIHDLLLPMLYFREDNFYPFVLDWQENCNGRTIAPGLGIYFLDPKEGNWSLQDAMQQIYFTRGAHVPGQAYFRAHFLLDNVQGLFDEIKKDIYKFPALIPPMKWQDSIPPTAPTEVHSEIKADSLILTWNGATDNTLKEIKNVPPLRYNIYASNKKNIDTNNAQNLIATYINDTRFAIALSKAKGLYFKVTAVDCFGNESIHSQHKHSTLPPGQVAAKKITLPECTQAVKVTVSDLYGRIIWQENYKQQLSIGRFAPGVYKVILQDQKGNILKHLQFIR